MKMVKTFNKDISTTVCDASSRKKKEKRKYTKQELCLSLRRVIVWPSLSHNILEDEGEGGERDSIRYKAQYTIIYSL